jgi:hypothetical protein
MGYPQGIPTPVPGAFGDPCAHPIYPEPQIDPCFEALKGTLEETLTTSDLAPHIHAPFGARFLSKVIRGVVAVPAAYDAAAFAGSLNLALATTAISGGTGNLALFLVPTAAAPPFEALSFFEYTPPAGHFAVFKTWGITVQNSVPEAAVVSLEAPGPSQGADPPHALLSGSLAELHQPTMLLIPENKTLKLRIQNLDTGSGILFTFGITGWQFPVRGYKGNLKSLLKNPGFGRGC